jgi:hypothetical protein
MVLDQHRDAGQRPVGRHVRRALPRLLIRSLDEKPERAMGRLGPGYRGLDEFGRGGLARSDQLGLGHPVEPAVGGVNHVMRPETRSSRRRRPP